MNNNGMYIIGQLSHNIRPSVMQYQHNKPRPEFVNVPTVQECRVQECRTMPLDSASEAWTFQLPTLYWWISQVGDKLNYVQYYSICCIWYLPR